VYEIYLLPAAQKDLDELESRIFQRVIQRIPSLSADARPHDSLKLTREEGYRLRSGDYRLLYRIDDGARRIYIYRIKHRKDAYGK